MFYLFELYSCVKALQIYINSGISIFSEVDNVIVDPQSVLGVYPD